MNRFVLALVPFVSIAPLTLACSSSNSTEPDASPSKDAAPSSDARADTTPATDSAPPSDSSHDTAPPGDSGGDAGTDSAPSLSFSTDVYTIIGSHCTFCHGLVDGGEGSGIKFGHLDMGTESAAYGNLVGEAGAGVLAQGKACGHLGDAGLLRVDPSNAVQSLFYNKVESNDGDGGSLTYADGGLVVLCGNPMPDHGDRLPSADLATIQTWINEGAKP
jgi:hypothetical protein